MNFDFKLPACSSFFEVLGRKMRSPQGATRGGVGCRVRLNGDTALSRLGLATVTARSGYWNFLAQGLELATASSG